MSKMHTLRGGARAGAGRPASPDKRRPRGIGLTDAELAEIAAIAVARDVSVPDAVMLAVRWFNRGTL